MQFAAIGGILLWLWLDSGFERFLDGLAGVFPDPVAQPAPGQSIIFLCPPLGASDFWSRFWPMLGVVTLAAGSGVVIVAGLMWGPPRQRSLLAWGLLIAICAAWIGVGRSLRDLCWLAKRQRVRQEVREVLPIAESLRNSWPEMDGELEGLGPFMAYPIDSPSVLILLTPPSFHGGEAIVSAVERSDLGALRFELAGAERGDWLEWHPEGSAPASFVGGLEAPYDLLKASPLGDQWYLARYTSPMVSKR